MSPLPRAPTSRGSSQKSKASKNIRYAEIEENGALVKTNKLARIGEERWEAADPGRSWPDHDR